MIERKVLLVDDVMLTRENLRNILENNGFKILGEAENGFEAIKKYQQLKPDLVTLDIEMPGLDGLETLKMLKMLDEDCKVIIISELENKRAEALICGAKAFIEEPFRPQTLINILQRV